MPRVGRPPVLEDYLAGARPAGRVGAERLHATRTERRGCRDRTDDGVPLATTPRNLYAAFVCVDRDPGTRRARLSKRDAIAQDDQVVLMLDTFHDRQRAYLFAVNPLGIQADALAHAKGAMTTTASIRCGVRKADSCATGSSC